MPPRRKKATRRKAKKTTRKKAKRGKGRPRIEIDWTQFDKLCDYQCTEIEIADFFNCSTDTIGRSVQRDHGMLFRDYYARRRVHGKVDLRRMQWKSAKNGSVAMQIWLGKQVLGQREHRDTGQQDAIQKGQRLIVRLVDDDEKPEDA